MTIKDARQEIIERMVHVRTNWGRTRMQLEFLQRTWTSLSDDHLIMQGETVKILVDKLETARRRVNRLVKKPKELTPEAQEKLEIHRWKYPFFKPYLDETIRSLDKWQSLFDPSWYLILRIADPVIDRELQTNTTTSSAQGVALLQTATRFRNAVRGVQREDQHTFLSSSKLDMAHCEAIRHSSAKFAKRIDKDEWFIVDPVPCPSIAYVGLMTEDIRALANKLQQVEPSTFGVLNCQGVIKVREHSRLKSFDIVFKTPTSGRPRTLRTCLTQRTTHSLTERIDLAKQLAKSVSYVHALAFVHKNVRPENLLGFETGHDKLEMFYLIGFEQVRSADGKTYLRGDTDWHRNIYRHPTRQGSAPEEEYRMQHDIYSLGVCLLEIGLWDSLVMYDNSGRVKTPNTVLLGQPLEKLRRQGPDQIKDLLVSLASHELARVVGDAYREVVVNCLTCLDEDNPDFGDDSEFKDADGVAVGVRYIGKVGLLNSDESMIC